MKPTKQTFLFSYQAYLIYKLISSQEKCTSTNTSANQLHPTTDPSPTAPHRSVMNEGNLFLIWFRSNLGREKKKTGKWSCWTIPRSQFFVLLTNIWYLIWLVGAQCPSLHVPVIKFKICELSVKGRQIRSELRPPTAPPPPICNQSCAAAEMIISLSHLINLHNLNTSRLHQVKWRKRHNYLLVHSLQDDT